MENNINNQNYAVIEGGIVTNIVVADSPEALPGLTLVPADSAAIGDAWDGSSFSRPPAVVPVPPFVTMRQARRELHRLGILGQVDAAIAALPEPQRTEAAIEWEFASTVDRTNPLVVSLCQSLGMTTEQIDALFISANTI